MRVSLGEDLESESIENIRIELIRFSNDYRNRSEVTPTHKLTKPRSKDKNKFILEKKMFEEDRQAYEALEAYKIKKEVLSSYR